MKTVLSTKKLTEKQKIKLENAGFLVVEENFITIKRLPFSSETVYENIIVTSKNAVKGIVKQQPKLAKNRVFCVGKKTRKLLLKKGFTVVETEDYAEDLARKIVEKYTEQSFTFFSGNLRKNTLPNTLNENNMKWNEVEVYATKLNPHKIKTPVDAILFFSPSGVKSYLKKNELQNKVCICIGKTTAKALENKTQNSVIADEPNLNKVIEKTINVFTENSELKTEN